MTSAITETLNPSRKVKMGLLKISNKEHNLCGTDFRSLYIIFGVISLKEPGLTSKKVEKMMKYGKIKNCGEVGIEFSIEDSEGTRVTKDFLENLIEGTVRRSVEYFDETGDYAFSYRERQMHSVVCPSIAALTAAYLMEHPLKRKPSGEDEYSGRVDYWISYRNYSFLMELKHGYFAYARASDPRQNLLEKFNSAMDSLKSIRKDECEYLGGGDKGLFKIALMAITFFRGSKDETSINDLRSKDLKLSFDELLSNSGLASVTNLRALWILSKRLVQPMKYINGFEIYPAVAFVGSVS
jgi:hypothetical protein